MQTYFGNHLGVVINEDDPEQRGRVQVFIPYIMPTLFEDWKKENVDVNFNALGDNVINALGQDKIKQLIEVLPWAECAAPILGSGTNATMANNGAVNNQTGGTTNQPEFVDARASENPPATIEGPQKTTANQPEPYDGTEEDFIPLEGEVTRTDGSLSMTIDSEDINVSNMSPDFASHYTRVFNALEGSRFVGQIPQDGMKYGITTGSRAEWAHFFTRLASVESSFNPNTAADINGFRNGPLTSFGLYQMGRDQFNRHGGGNIYNPDDNTNSFVKYAESMYFDNVYKSGGQNVIAGKTGDRWLGIAAGYGPLRQTFLNRASKNQQQLLAENIESSQQQKGSYTNVASYETPIINDTLHPTPTAATPIDTTALPSGSFSIPKAGAFVWCFFQQGDPQFPVYFAVAYTKNQWVNAYTRNDYPQSDGINRSQIAVAENGSGVVIIGTNTLDAADPLASEDAGEKDHRGVRLFAASGAYVHPHAKGITTYSPNEIFEHALGNAYRLCMNREDHVTGDANFVVNGDSFEIVGNVTPQAIASIQKHAQKVFDVNSKTA